MEEASTSILQPSSQELKYESDFQSDSFICGVVEGIINFYDIIFNAVYI